MDGHQIDIELYTKTKETFKLILKKVDTSIIFNEPDFDNQLIESINITNKDHVFFLNKKFDASDLLNINDKYYNLIPINIKQQLSNIIDIEDKRKYLKRKTWYLNIFYPIFGRLFEITYNSFELFSITYNGIVIDLTKLEYDRFVYYTHYVYKLQQLRKLNYELNINQEFSIVFDDDKIINEMYQNIFDNFKDIIKIFDDDNSDDYNDEDDF